jgi:hypothetical protein
VIIRDYGMYDMTQMRFINKRGRKLGENFYMRADGTRTYFFSKGIGDCPKTVLNARNVTYVRNV